LPSFSPVLIMTAGEAGKASEGESREDEEEEDDEEEEEEEQEEDEEEGEARPAKYEDREGPAALRSWMMATASCHTNSLWGCISEGTAPPCNSSRRERKAACVSAFRLASFSSTVAPLTPLIASSRPARSACPSGVQESSSLSSIR